MKGLSFAMLAVLALAGCATHRLGDTERLALYQANAGAPVSSFRYFGNINGWTSLGDRALAVWTRPNQAYLLELVGRCPGLDFTQAISVSNSIDRVHARFDSVTVVDGHSAPFRCRIQQIRPIDVKALKVAEREMRQDIEMAERAQSSGET